jgi:hypothetical protein
MSWHCPALVAWRLADTAHVLTSLLLHCCVPFFLRSLIDAMGSKQDTQEQITQASLGFGFSLTHACRTPLDGNPGTLSLAMLAFVL